MLASFTFRAASRRGTREEEEDRGTGWQHCWIPEGDVRSGWAVGWLDRSVGRLGGMGRETWIWYIPPGLSLVVGGPWDEGRILGRGLGSMFIFVLLLLTPTYLRYLIACPFSPRTFDTYYLVHFPIAGLVWFVCW